MAITLNEFVNSIGWEVDEKSLKAGVAKATKALNAVKPVAKNLTKWVSLPLLALGGVSVKLASDAKESSNKFNTVFKDIRAEANMVADTFAKDFGLAGSSARTAIGDTSDLLTGFGFGQKEALGLANKVNRLGVDLASFTNYAGGASGASAMLTKALLGETEGVKGLGMAILQKDVYEQVAIDRAKGMTFATERQARAQATYTLMVMQSKNAVGDYARTSQSLANSTKRLREGIKKLAISFGKILMPIVNAFVHVMEFFVKVITAIPAPLKIFLVIIGAILIIVPPLVLAIVSLTTAIMGMSASMIVATGGLILLIPLIIGIIAGIIALGIYFGKMIKKWMQGSEAFQMFAQTIKDVVGTIKRILIPILAIVLLPLKLLWAVVKFVFGSIFKFIGFVIEGWVALFSFLIFYLNRFVNWFMDLFKPIFDYFKNLWSDVKVVWDYALFELAVGLLVFGKSMLRWIINWVDNIVAKFEELKDAVDVISDYIQEKTAFLDKPIEGLVNMFMGGKKEFTAEDEANQKAKTTALIRARNAKNGGNVKQENSVVINVAGNVSDADAKKVEKAVTNGVNGGLDKAVASTAGQE